MHGLIGLTVSLADRVNGLISKAEDEHPGLQEVAAMVYVGDIYVLREQTAPVKSDGWGNQTYIGDAPGPL